MTPAESTAALRFLAAANGIAARGHYILKRLRMSFRLGCAVGCLFSCGADAAPAEMAACGEFARQAIASEAPNSNRVTPPSRDLCFSNDSRCAGTGSLSAQQVWENSLKASDLRAELMEYRDWTGRVSEVAMPSMGGASMGGALVHIARRIGTAHCIRDTYLLRQDNHYRSIHSISLDQLSAEANCGDVGVRLTQSAGELLLVTAFYGILTAYRFAPNFELREVCTIRYRAPRIAR